MRRSLLKGLRWTCLYRGWKADLLIYKQPLNEKKLPLYILEVKVNTVICMVTESCHSHTHTRVHIWWRKLSGSHKPVCVEQDVKVQWCEQALFCLSHALSSAISLCPGKTSLPCRKGHEEHMEGLWSLLVHGIGRLKKSGNFRELNFKPLILVLSLFFPLWSFLFLFC